MIRDYFVFIRQPEPPSFFWGVKCSFPAERIPGCASHTTSRAIAWMKMMRNTIAIGYTVA